MNTKNDYIDRFEPTAMYPKFAAKYLGLSESMLKRLRAKGTGPKFLKLDIGKNCRVVYLRKELDQWLDELVAKRDGAFPNSIDMPC